jgi:hypothetical protein
MGHEVAATRSANTTLGVAFGSVLALTGGKLGRTREQEQYSLLPGVSLITGGADNHMTVMDVEKSFGIDGRVAQEALDKIGITANKQVIPDDPLGAGEDEGRDGRALPQLPGAGDRLRGGTADQAEGWGK